MAEAGQGKAGKDAFGSGEPVQSTRERQTEIRDIGKPAIRRYALSAIVGYLFLFGGTLWGLHAVQESVNSAHAQQAETCRIQNVGLEAKKYLNGSLAGIHTLLRPLPGEAKPTQPIPPSVLNVIATLDHNLAEYDRIEKRLPEEHRC
jgi:hypothetical protein